MSTPCPDRDVLRRFLAGVSPEDEQRLLEAHLEECEACQADLNAMDGGDESWLGRMRNLRRDTDASAPGLKRIIGVLKDEVEPDPETTGFAPVTPGEILGFLDPADSPGDLGKLATYRVLEVLGEGSMGVVLKAVDPALNRTVAIKVLAPQLATSSSARQRFAREARAAAAIRNEHVVAIHSVDEWKGLPYLVMEFIPGASLQQRIDRTGPLDLNSTLRIGMQAATGLAAAHAQGLVHRDIKPSNILLENCVERVKITDFGLARAVDDASLTQSGVVAGTPLFMAPEQARCESIDHRADLFSLGSVLYAMCTGRSPFRAPTTMGVLRRVCDDIHRPVLEVNPEIPVELTTVIDRLLAKEPSQRFQTAAEVAERLEQLLARRQQGWTGENEVVQAVVEPLPVEDVGPVKRPRHRRLLQAAACLLVILSGAFVVAEGTGTTRVIDTIATVLKIKTNDGTLVLEVFDPAAVVDVDHQRVSIKGLGLSSITLEPGAHCVEKIDGQGNVSTEWISIKRGGRLLVKVGREPNQPRPAVTSPLPALRQGPISGGGPTINPTLNTEVKGLHGQLAFAMGGRYLVGAGPGAELGVYDTLTKKLRSHAIEGGDVKALEVNDEIRTILTASADGRVRFWDIFPLAEGDWPMKPHATPDLHGLHVTALAMSKDSRLLALGGADGKLVLWDRKRDIRADLAIKLGSAITAIRFSPDDSIIAVGTEGGGSIWKVDRDDPVQLTKFGIKDLEDLRDVRFLTFCHGGRTFAAASPTRFLLWGKGRSPLPESHPIHSNSFTQIASNHADRYPIAVGRTSGTVIFWDADDRGTPPFPMSHSPIVGLAFSPDGRTLATWGRGDASTKIWDLSSMNVGSWSKATSKERQAKLEAKKAEVVRMRETLDQFRETGYPKAAYARELERLAQAEAELAALQGQAFDAARLYEALAGPAQAPPAPPAPPPPLKVVDSPRIPAQQAMEQLRQAQAALEAAQAEVERAKARLEMCVAKAAAATKKVARMEELLSRQAIEQRILDEANDQRAAALSERDSAESYLKVAEIKLRSAQDEVSEARKLLETVSEPGPDTPERRQDVLRLHNQTALRRAQANRDLAAAELDAFKATLVGAQANHDYRKKVTARMRQLVEHRAVEQRVLDEAETKEKGAEARLRLAQIDVAQAENKLKAAEERLREVKAGSRPAPVPDGDAALWHQIGREFREDPEVTPLIDEIRKAKDELEHMKTLAKHARDPNLLMSQERLKHLYEEYNNLWDRKSEELRRKHADPAK